MLPTKRDSVSTLPDMSNWLGSQRCDADPNGIECVPDFDGSLGVNGSMSELSYSLGLASSSNNHDQESLSHNGRMVDSLVQYVTAGGGVDSMTSMSSGTREQLLPPNSSMSTTEWVNQISLMTNNSTTSEKFQHVLLVGTSPVTRRNEETLTYLNQGQSYEIRLKKVNGCNNEEFYKSIIRVVFHERRLQYIEREQLDLWRQTRPGERIVDIDIPLSYGLLDVKIDPRFLNCIEVVWNPNKDSSLFIKVHCISTEFTQHKHGGEKGVPFRIQVETYAVSDVGPHEDSQLVHCASCQIKVFKPKGADRKHKRDMEKIMKTSDFEKAKYHPVYPYTLLTEIPIEQVLSYLVQLRKHHEEMAKQYTDDTGRSTTSGTSIDGRPSSISLNDSLAESAMSNGRHFFRKFNDQVYCQKQSSCDSLDSLSRRTIQSLPKLNLLPKLSLPPQFNATSMQTVQDDLLPDYDCMQVVEWLTRYRFTNYVKLFRNYSGSDLLSLSRSDLVELCGLSDGIRLNNALQARSVRPKLTLYVCRDHQSNKVPTSTSENKKKYLSWNIDKFLGSSSGSSRSVSPVDTITSPPPFYGNSETGISSTMSSNQTLMRAMSMGSFQQPLAPSSAALLNDRSHQSHRIPSGIYSAPNVALATKRQCDVRERSFDDLSSTKRRRAHTLDSVDDEVYSAVYLEFLTCRHLAYKISTDIGLDPDQITQILIQGPSNIRVLVTDAVVQNFVDQSRYLMQLFAG